MLSSDQSPLLELDEQNQVSRSNYNRWKETVAEHSHAILEYRRIANEVNDLETNMAALEEGLSESTRQLNDAKESASDLESQVASLRELLDSSSRWAEAAIRIAEKRMQVNQKQVDLTISTGIDTKGRDLSAVERDMHDRQEERENYTNKASTTGQRI
jgi:chromosome segregation ATPase